MIGKYLYHKFVNFVKVILTNGEYFLMSVITILLTNIFSTYLELSVWQMIVLNVKITVIIEFI